MSVCLRCGGQIKETDKFCGLCGYPTKRQTKTQQTTTSKQASNTAPPQLRTMEEFIAEINRMLAYFSKVQSLYDEYESCEKTVKELKRKRKNRYEDKDFFESLELLSKGEPDEISNWLFSLGTVLTLLMIPIFIFLPWPYSLLIAIGLSYFCALFVFLGVRFTIKANKEKQAELLTISQYGNRMESLDAMLRNYYNSYDYCIVRFDDSNPRILFKAREYLMSGKAKTFEKALRMARRR